MASITGDFFSYLMDKARHGYKAVIFDCFRDFEGLVDPNKNFASFYIAASQENRVDPKDSEAVKAEIQKRLQNLKEANVSNKEILRLLFFLSFLCDNNLPSVSDWMMRVEDHLHARSKVTPGLLIEARARVLKLLERYQEQYISFFLWYLQQDDDAFTSLETDRKAKALKLAYTQFLGEYLKYLNELKIKTAKNLLIVTERDLSLLSMADIFERNRKLAIFCSGALNRDALTKKLTSIKLDPVGEDFVNEAYRRDIKRGTYILKKYGQVINSFPEFDLRKEVKSDNRAALLSNLAYQSINAIFESFKNKFSSQGYGFGLTNLSEYEVIIDITDEGLYRFKAYTNTLKAYRHGGNETQYVVENAPTFYMNVEFDIKCAWDKKGNEVFEIVPTSEKVQIMVVGSAGEESVFKVKDSVVKPSRFPAGNIEGLSNYQEDFARYISGNKDFDACLTGGNSPEFYRETLEAYSLLDYYNSVWGAGFRSSESKYAQDCPVIESFLYRCATSKEIDYAYEGLILLNFADSQLQKRPYDTDAQERYSNLKAFAKKIMFLGWRRASTLKDALHEYRKAAACIVSSELINDDEILQKYFFFGNHLLSEINKLPPSKREVYVVNVDNGFDTVAAEISVTTILKNFKQPNMILANYMQAAIDKSQNSREIRKLLTSMASASPSASAKTLSEVLVLEDSAVNQKLGQQPGVLLTSQILSNRKIMGNRDTGVTGAEIVKLLEGHHDLAREVIRPGFWQSLFGINLNARFKVEDIKQLLRGHSFHAAGIFAKPPLFGRSLLNKLSAQDVVEIFLDSIFNDESKLLQALPLNKNIERKLIKMKDPSLKRSIYLALITFDYHQTQKLLFSYPDLETDFYKVVPEYNAAQRMIIAIEKKSPDITTYFNQEFPEQCREIANILLARCFCDTVLRVKVFENKPLIAKLREYANPLLLGKFPDLIKPDLIGIQKLIHEIQEILLHPTPTLLSRVKAKFEALDRMFQDSDISNVYLQKLKNYQAELKANSDFLSPIIRKKVDAQYEADKVLEKTKAIVENRKEIVAQLKLQFELLPDAEKLRTDTCGFEERLSLSLCEEEYDAPMAPAIFVP